MSALAPPPPRPHIARRAIRGGLCVLFLASAPLRGLNPELPPDQYIRRHWDLRSGLPQNSVVSLAQTPDDYLWLATFGGLVRFNGNGFELFTPPGIPPWRPCGWPR
jgi:hypothetical protein